MKLQIRLILIFVSLSVLGIFFFQGYWLWNSFRIDKQQLQRTINETFQVAIGEELTLRLEKLKNDSTPEAFHGEIEFQFTVDSTSTIQKPRLSPYTRTRLQQQAKNDSVIYKLHNPEDIPLMRTAFKGIWQAVNGLSPVDLNQVDSLWNRHLEQENITSKHFIDFTQGPDTLLDTTLPDNYNPTDLMSTQKFGVSTDDSIGIQGFIISPDKAIFKQMGSLMVASLFLLVITTACYLFLIRTIFKQKTIAQIKNDFVNNMTHELKTPITITYSAIDALQTFKLVEQKETRDEYFTLCRQQLKHLSGLVEKILSMAVDERKNFRLQKELFPLQPILDSLLQQFKFKAGKPISFSIDVSNELFIYADKLHFTNVISNLIDNAIKYSGATVEIQISARNVNGQTRISVTDNGTGIPPSQQNRIFERFYRVPKGNIHDVKGFGLGLSYVKDIIEKHNGSITVQSKEKQGSTFTILIPEKK